MASSFKYAVATALIGMLAIAAATPSEARHARKKVVVVVVKTLTPGANVASTGSYDATLTRADYAYEPQYGYSNALFFQVWPRY